MNNRPTVAVVDRCSLYAQSVAAWLRQLGLAATGHHDVSDGVDWNGYDVVVMNVAYPGSAGLVARLAASGGPATIVVGSGERHESVVRCLQAGAAGFVSATESIDSLAAAITETARRGSLGGRRLTSRQTQVLALIAAGRSNREIAVRLGIRLHTVKNHVHAILEKLEAGSRAEAAARFVGAAGLARTAAWSHR
ncbi:LuxR C-terminal-related transcriptional regulator [Thermobifida cellulosilytica]|uniref:LuxR C-terminal-related transcriptional regulator n=1 Tax=Thermobifida cellulosilytica TaxID=144786 RepID=UPI000838C6C8|nr:response regulator transcription factor [Thermobifida cellulosilytica]